MNINLQEDLRISGYQPVVGFKGDELGEIFDYWIDSYGLRNIHFICSLVYNCGRVHGVREERVRRNSRKESRV